MSLLIERCKADSALLRRCSDPRLVRRCCIPYYANYLYNLPNTLEMVIGGLTLNGACCENILGDGFRWTLHSGDPNGSFVLNRISDRIWQTSSPVLSIRYRAYYDRECGELEFDKIFEYSGRVEIKPNYASCGHLRSLLDFGIGSVVGWSGCISDGDCFVPRATSLPDACFRDPGGSISLVAP